MKNLLILTALFFVGCTNQSETTKSPNPDILNSPSDIVIEVSQLQTLDNLVLSSDQTFSFGEATQVARDKSLVVSISNSSSSSIPLSISFPSLNGFKLSINRCAATLAANKSCQITVSFSNRNLFDGTYSNTLEVVSGSSSLTTVFDASSVGKPDPDLSGTPNLTVTMSSPFTNASPPYRDVVVKNIGDGTASSVNPQIVGTGYVIRINRCTSNLKPQQSCTLQVSWKDYRTNPTPGPGTINVSENSNPPKIINLQNGQEEVSGPTSLQSLAMGFSYVCGTKVDGSLHCSGQHGTDFMNSDYSFRTMVTPGSIKLYQGPYSVCYIDQTTNLVYCAGYNYGQFGLGDPLLVGDGSGFSSDFILTGFSQAKSMAVGWTHICIIKLDDTVECAGSNDNGQFGNVTFDNTVIPVGAPNFGYVKQIGISNHGTTCVLRMNNNMACAGYNYNNLFGVPSLPDGPVNYPVESEDFVGLKSISHQSYSTCAQFLDNKVKCVGADSQSSSPALQEYPEFENADEYSQDSVHFCARLGTQVKCLAGNYVEYGYLGSQSLYEDCVNNGNCVSVGPAIISEFSNAKKLIVGPSGTCIIDINDKVMCSGLNEHGRFDPSTPGQIVPWARDVLPISY